MTKEEKMTKRFRQSIVALMMGGVLMLGGVSTGWGQDDEEGFMLEEITVTAQKREENQQKVAIAMEVVTGEEIAALGKNDIDEILGNISSVIINQASDGLRVSLRGMSNDNGVFNNMQVSTPTVAVNKDGVYSNRNSGNTDLFDVERVEVLFGPQSTMYASATPGGIVNVVTGSPKLETYSATGSVEYGNYEHLKTEGSVNVPVGNSMALRAAFSTTSHDGYLTNGGMDEESKSARLRAMYQPNDNFSITITGQLTKTGGQGFSDVESFEDQDGADNPWTAASEEPGNENKQENKRLYANIDVGMGGGGTLSVIPTYSESTNYRSGVQAGQVAPGADADAEADDVLRTDEGSGDEKGIEARLASPAEFFFKWILGVNYYESREDQSSISYNQGSDGDDEADELGDRWNEQETLAVYGNMTYPITEEFRASAGVRQTWDENESYNHQIPGKPPTPDELIETTKMEYDDPNFMLGVEYDLASTSMVYANWTTSYRTQSSGTKGADYEPEELSAYTAGAKNRFFSNKLQLNISAYYYDYKNYFAVVGPMNTILDENNNGIRDEGEDTETEDTGNLAQGDARVYGFDLQTTTIITHKDKLDISISYIKKEFTDLVFDFFDITNSFGLEDIDYSGKEMPNAPNWTINLNYSHAFSLPNGGTLTPHLEWRYTSDYVLNFQAYEVQLYDNADGSKGWSITDTSGVRDQEAYYMTDLSLVYANPDSKWTLTAYVKNLEDYAVKRGLFMGNLQIGPPRTYGATLSVRF
jgi:iron complex outermembrane receptor protein